MFNLSESHYNIVKQTARACISAMRSQIADGKSYGDIAPATISEYHQKVHTLVSLLQFVWLCGYLTGQFGGRIDYE